MEMILLYAYFFFFFFLRLWHDPRAPSNSVESLSWWSGNKCTVHLWYKVYSRVKERRYFLGLRGKSSGLELIQELNVPIKILNYSSLNNLITLINFSRTQWCLSNISQNKHGFRFKIFKIASCGHDILLICKVKRKPTLCRAQEEGTKWSLLITVDS